MKCRAFIATMFVVAFMSQRANADAQGRELGIEREITVTLERGDYLPRPLDDRTPVIVRLGGVEKKDGGHEYRLHLIGFEPGEHRLADYLMHPDGSAATELADTTFEVATILPPDHDGSLTPHLPAALPWFGGYRIVLAAMAVTWVLGWIVLHRWGRRARTGPMETNEPAAPGFDERLRPYLERAAAGKLDVSGQAELERLLIGYWRDKLGIAGETMTHGLAQLRRHPEAGETLIALERWLHRPGGAKDDEIEALLAPYRPSQTPEEVIS
jgi:hypothetical protein